MKKMDLWIISILIVVIIIIILVVCVEWIIQRFLFYPTTGPIGRLEGGHYFRTPHGISCAFFDRGGPILMHSHGNAGNIESRYGLVHQNISLFLYDYRGFGESVPLTPTTTSILEDGNHVFEYIQSEYPNRPIILWGESMGSSVAWALAKKYDVAGVIITSGYASLKDVILETVPGWVGRILDLCGTLKGLPDNAPDAEHVRAPIRIYHAEDDTLIQMSHAERMHIRTDGTLIRTQGGHNFDMGPYLNELRPWITH